MIDYRMKPPDPWPIPGLNVPEPTGATMLARLVEAQTLHGLLQFVVDRRRSEHGPNTSEYDSLSCEGVEGCDPGPSRNLLAPPNEPLEATPP